MMNKLLLSSITIIMIMMVISVFPQSTQQKNEQQGINERINVLEKGQAGLKTKSIVIKKTLEDQKHMADSVCERVKLMEQELLLQTDTIKARMSNLSETQHEIGVIKERLHNRKLYAIYGGIAVAIGFLVLLIIILMIQKKISTLKTLIEESAAAHEERLEKFSEQVQAEENTIKSLSQELTNLKTVHQNDHESMNFKVSNLSQTWAGETDSIKKSIMQIHTETEGTLKNKLEAFSKEVHDKIEKLTAAIEPLLKNKNKTEKKD
ncbi:MAG: hypothetical protein AB9842_00805 [Bacteroidales bacterium]